jgi:hypothetical protein
MKKNGTRGFSRFRQGFIILSEDDDVRGRLQKYEVLFRKTTIVIEWFGVAPCGGRFPLHFLTFAGSGCLPDQIYGGYLG